MKEHEYQCPYKSDPVQPNSGKHTFKPLPVRMTSPEVARWNQNQVQPLSKITLI